MLFFIGFKIFYITIRLYFAVIKANHRKIIMSFITIEKPAIGVTLLKINRPDALNALNNQIKKDISEHFNSLSKDPETMCIIIAGSNKVFAAGADIKEFAEKGAAEIALENGRAVWQPLRQCSKPIIAAVNGYALGGGCELAMHADIIIAGKNAKFGQPEIKIGIMAGAGGTQNLVRTVGKFKAMKILLTGEPIDAMEAYSMGLASEVVDDDQVLIRAIDLAKKIANLPPIAIRHTKEVVLAGSDTTLEAGILLERKAFELLFDTEDQKEGMRAFIEKRKPNFKGK